MTTTAAPEQTDQITDASLAEAQRYLAYQERLSGAWTNDHEWARSAAAEACAQDMMHEEPART